jgi:exosome complex RNA-binding protein Rrp42 (RNase PH superfamily)
MHAFREIYPSTFYAKFLEHSLRPDGRQLDELRPCTVSVGTIQSALGSATVKIGKTAVVCGVTGQLGYRADPKISLVQVLVELSPLSSPDIRPGSNAHAGVLTRKMQSLLCTVGVEVVPVAQLVVDRGEKVLYWHLQVDAYCVEDDGCVFDACLLACVSALKVCVICYLDLNFVLSHCDSEYLSSNARVSNCHITLCNTTATTSHPIKTIQCALRSLICCAGNVGHRGSLHRGGESGWLVVARHLDGRRQFT